jgi:hypothetical protein
MAFGNPRNGREIDRIGVQRSDKHCRGRFALDQIEGPLDLGHFLQLRLGAEARPQRCVDHRRSTADAVHDQDPKRTRKVANTHDGT